MRVFMATGLYVQGPDVLDDVGRRLSGLGQRALLACDPAVEPLVGPRLTASLAVGGIVGEGCTVSGTVTAAAITTLARRAREAGADLVLGAGGGRVLDAAKGAALEAGLPFVSVPTIASSDAPASRGVPVLDDAQRIVEVRQAPRNPFAIFVDTALIARAPVRFLVAGMGDALSKHLEAEACGRSRARTKHGALPPRIAGLIARGCMDTVRAQGLAALAEARAGRPGEAFEDTVEAIVLMSCLAFENGGLAMAHALAPALQELGDPGALHGEHAAYGALVQAVYEDRPRAEVDDLLAFAAGAGLPRSIAAFARGAEAGPLIEAVSARACAVPHMRHQPGPVAPAGVAAAMRRLEAWGGH